MIIGLVIGVIIGLLAGIFGTVYMITQHPTMIVSRMDMEDMMKLAEQMMDGEVFEGFEGEAEEGGA